MQLMYRFSPLAGSVGLALVAGCSGGDSGRTVSTDSSVVGDSDVAQVGLVSFDGSGELIVDDAGTAVFASFLALDEPMSGSVLADFQREFVERHTERCIAVRSGDEESAEEERVLDRVNVTGISAGEVIVLSTPAGTIAELTEGVYYASLSGEVPGIFPVGTIMDIPGAAFPAFPAQPLPIVEPVRDVVVGTDEAGMVAPEGRITWKQATDPGRSVDISLHRFFAGVDGLLSVECTTADDGEFTFPVELTGVIGGAEFVPERVFVRRNGLSFERSGDALLVLEHSHTRAADR